MRKLPLFFALVEAIASSSCKRSSVASPPAQATSRALATSSVDAGSPKSSDTQLEPKPLTDGKRLRLTRLEVPPVEVTVPTDFVIRMQEGEESVPVAHLEGPDLEVHVKYPDSRISSLEQEKRMLTDSFPKLVFIRSDQLQNGYLLVMRDISPLGETVYATNVLRPDLNLYCGAVDLKKLEDAYRAASICLSLQRTPRKQSH